MNKKLKWTLIIIAGVILISIGVFLLIKYTPFYVTIIGLGAFVCGCIIGWIIKGFYIKHFKK